LKLKIKQLNTSPSPSKGVSATQGDYDYRIRQHGMDAAIGAFRKSVDDFFCKTNKPCIPEGNRQKITG
jgi:hypothetical protein